MPSKSAAQAKFMRAVAHGMKPKGGGPSIQVAREFVEADRQKNTKYRLRIKKRRDSPYGRDK